jgi:hypothetical protein
VKTDIHAVVCVRDTSITCYYIQAVLVLRFFALPFANTQHLIYALRISLTGSVLLRVCNIIYLRLFFFAHFSANQQVQKIRAWCTGLKPSRWSRSTKHSIVWSTDMPTTRHARSVVFLIDIRTTDYPSFVKTLLSWTLLPCSQNLYQKSDLLQWTRTLP